MDVDEPAPGGAVLGCTATFAQPQLQPQPQPQPQPALQPQPPAAAVRTTPLGAGTMSRDDSGCDPARGCRWLHMSGNCFHCVQHPGAVHVCDMRCRFRDVAVSETGAISYRCRVSGLVTSRRLCVGLAPTDANVRKRGADGEEAGADRGPLRKMG